MAWECYRDDQQSNLVPSPVLPRFSGLHPAQWISQADGYFLFYSIYGDERFSYVIEVFEDEPFYWFNSWFRNADLTWTDFTMALLNRFSAGALIQSNPVTLQASASDLISPLESDTKTANHQLPVVESPLNPNPSIPSMGDSDGTHMGFPAVLMRENGFPHQTSPAHFPFTCPVQVVPRPTHIVPVLSFGMVTDGPSSHFDTELQGLALGFAPDLVLAPNPYFHREVMRFQHVGEAFIESSKSVFVLPPIVTAPIVQASKPHTGVIWSEPLVLLHQYKATNTDARTVWEFNKTSSDNQVLQFLLGDHRLGWKGGTTNLIPYRIAMVQTDTTLPDFIHVPCSDSQKFAGHVVVDVHPRITQKLGTDSYGGNATGKHMLRTQFTSLFMPYKHIKRVQWVITKITIMETAMVLGMKTKIKKSPHVQLGYIINLIEIKPWPPSHSLRSLRSVLIRCEHGDKISGSTKPVTPSIVSGSGIGDGNIIFHESFRVHVTLSRDPSIKTGDNETFLRNGIEFNMYEPQRDKSVTGRLLATAVIDFEEYGMVKRGLIIRVPMNCKWNFGNTAQPMFFVKIQMVEKDNRVKTNPPCPIPLGTTLLVFYANYRSHKNLADLFANLPRTNVFSWVVLIRDIARNCQADLVDKPIAVFASLRGDFNRVPRIEHYGYTVDIFLADTFTVRGHFRSIVLVYMWHKVYDVFYILLLSARSTTDSLGSSILVELFMLVRKQKLNYDEALNLLSTCLDPCQHLPISLILFSHELSAILVSKTLHLDLMERVGQLIGAVECMFLSGLESGKLHVSDLYYGLKRELWLHLDRDMSPIFMHILSMHSSSSRSTSLQTVLAIRLLSVMERLGNQGSLGGIAALRGCPIHFHSSKFIVEPWSSLSNKQKHVVCHSLYYAINWLRELHNVFSTQVAGSFDLISRATKEVVVTYMDEYAIILRQKSWSSLMVSLFLDKMEPTIADLQFLVAQLLASITPSSNCPKVHPLLLSLGGFAKDLLFPYLSLNHDSFMDPQITSFAALYGHKPLNVARYLRRLFILHLEDKVNLKRGSNVMNPIALSHGPNMAAQSMKPIKMKGCGSCDISWYSEERRVKKSLFKSVMASSSHLPV